jgi:hypothetical protein
MPVCGGDAANRQSIETTEEACGMKRWTVIALSVSMVAVGAGIGGAATSTIVIGRGNTAEFRVRGGPWFCRNVGATVSCLSGDALPRATLGVDRTVVALRVNSLARPCISRIRRPSPDPTDPAMKPYWEYLYTFKAFGCP